MTARPMRIGARHLCAVLAALAIAPITAGATIIPLAASIDGAQANRGDGTGSPGTGSAMLTFDDQTRELTWSGSFSGLLGDFTVSHFHGPALPGTHAAAQLRFHVDLDPGNRSGTFNGSDMLDPEDAADLLAGLWFINIHSQFVTGGEIRGQVLPEPSALLRFGAALAGLALAGRLRGGA